MAALQVGEQAADAPADATLTFRFRADLERSANWTTLRQAICILVAGKLGNGQISKEATAGGNQRGQKLREIKKPSRRCQKVQSRARSGTWFDDQRIEMVLNFFKGDYWSIRPWI